MLYTYLRWSASARAHVHTSLPYLANGWADCVQTWCVASDPLDERLTQVRCGVHLHVRTCTPPSNDGASWPARPSPIKASYWCLVHRFVWKLIDENLPYEKVSWNLHASLYHTVAQFGEITSNWTSACQLLSFFQLESVRTARSDIFPITGGSTRLFFGGGASLGGGSLTYPHFQVSTDLGHYFEIAVLTFFYFVKFVHFLVVLGVKQATLGLWAMADGPSWCPPPTAWFPQCFQYLSSYIQYLSCTDEWWIVYRWRILRHCAMPIG